MILISENLWRVGGIQEDRKKKMKVVDILQNRKVKIKEKEQGNYGLFRETLILKKKNLRTKQQNNFRLLRWVDLGHQPDVPAILSHLLFNRAMGENKMVSLKEIACQLPSRVKLTQRRKK